MKSLAKQLSLVVAPLVLALAPTPSLAQAGGAQAERALTFDRFDRTSRRLIETIGCIQQLARGQARGIFGKDADVGPEYECFEQDGRRLAAMATLDSAATKFLRLVAMDLATGERFLGRVDSLRLLSQFQATSRSVDRAIAAFEAKGIDVAPLTIRTDGDSLEVWLLPAKVFLGAMPTALGGEHGFIYSPNGQTLVREINAIAKYRPFVVPDTGQVNVTSLEDDMPLISEFMVANALNAAGRKVSIATKAYFSNLAGAGAAAIWLQFKRP